MRRAMMSALMVLTCQVGVGCIFGQEENIACAPTSEGERCCESQVVQINDDANNCGGCGIVCGQGDRCEQGACTCDQGAQPLLVANDIPASSRIFLLPSLSSERLLEADPNASSFEDFFSSDLSLLTYYAVTYEPEQSTVRVLGLNGRGELLPGLDSKLAPRPSGTRFTIKSVTLNQDFMGNLVMLILFDEDGVGGLRSELRSYRVMRGPAGFSLQNEQGEQLNSPGSKVYAIGTNKNVLDGIAIVYVVGTMEQGVVIAGSVIDDKGVALIEPISLGRTLRWPEGTELQASLSDDVLAVSWWKPDVLSGPLMDKAGDFEHVLFARDDNRFKSFRGPEKFADTVYLGRGLELPRSQPLFLLNERDKESWAYYQVTQAQGTSTVEIWNASRMEPAQNVARPTLAFGQDWSLQLRDLLYLEFSWVEGENLDQMPLTGGLHYASWGLDLNGQRPSELRAPAPLSASKVGYRNVRAAFGAPRTMGYLGHYDAGDKPGELHFYMTLDDKLVCQPKTFELGSAP